MADRVRKKELRIINGAGRYIYCIIETPGPLSFAVQPIGAGQKVFTVHYKDIAAVVSEADLKKYAVTRENTMAHQKVLETVLADHTLLPVRFGTVAKNEAAIIAFILESRYEELKELLSGMRNKNQYGLKVLWVDMAKVFQQIVADNPPIKELKNQLSKLPLADRSLQIELGHMVEAALTSRKDACGSTIMKPLKKIAYDIREGNLYGDEMFVNVNFLVEKDRQAELDAQINSLAESFGPEACFKYIGPIPPYDFVEITVVF